MAKKGSESEVSTSGRGAAYKRPEFKSNVQQHILGAITEFYAAVLAKKNGQSQWVEGMREVRSLLEVKLVAALVHPVTGFKDRRGAFEETAAEMKANDAVYRREAEAVMARYYKTGRQKASLGSSDTDAFWARVEEAATRALESAR